MAERPKGIPIITDASTKRVKIALLAAICPAAVFAPAAYAQITGK